jgi:hypothetical protein
MKTWMRVSSVTQSALAIACTGKNELCFSELRDMRILAYNGKYCH